MVLRNSFEKRTALERDIKTLTETNAQLEQDLATASETLDPLTARREELIRCRPYCCVLRQRGKAEGSASFNQACPCNS